MTLQSLDLLTPRRRDRDHLLDPDWQEQILHHRVQQLTWSAAGRLRSRVKGGMDPFAATLEVQDHLLALGRAWTEHHALLAARRALSTYPSGDDGVRALLSLITRVYALDRLWEHQAWYLRHGVMEAEKVRALRRVRQDSLRELRGVALRVCEAFDIPGGALGAPIAR